MSEQAPAGVVEAPRVQSSAVAFIFVTILLDMFALGLIMPILPKLVESFVANDTASAARIFGLFGTAWALMQFIFSPVQGSLSDHFGRRTVILVSCAGLGLDFILMAHHSTARNDHSDRNGLAFAHRASPHSGKAPRAST